MPTVVTGKQPSQLGGTGVLLLRHHPLQTRNNQEQFESIFSMASQATKDILMKVRKMVPPMLEKFHKGEIDCVSVSPRISC